MKKDIKILLEDFIKENKDVFMQNKVSVAERFINNIKLGNDSVFFYLSSDEEKKILSTPDLDEAIACAQDLVFSYLRKNFSYYITAEGNVPVKTKLVVLTKGDREVALGYILPEEPRTFNILSYPGRSILDNSLPLIGESKEWRLASEEDFIKFKVHPSKSYFNVQEYEFAQTKLSLEVQQLEEYCKHSSFAILTKELCDWAKDNFVQEPTEYGLYSDVVSNLVHTCSCGYEGKEKTLLYSIVELLENYDHITLDYKGDIDKGMSNSQEIVPILEKMKQISGAVSYSRPFLKKGIKI